MNKLLLLTILILVFVGCAPPQNHNLDDNTIFADYSLNDTLYLSDFVDSIRVVQLETASESIFTELIRVTRTRSDDLLLYVRVATDRRLILFDKNGQFIRTIGSTGRGPGEYVALTSFVYDEKSETVHIYDQTQMAIFKYSIHGAFLEKLKTNLIFEDFTITKDNYYILYGSFGSRHPDTNEKLGRGVYLADENGKYIETIHNINEADKYQFFNQHFFTRSERNSNLLSSFDDNIYSFKKENMMVNYKINYGKYSLQEYDRFNTELLELTGDFICAKAMPHENDRYLIFWTMFSENRRTAICLLDKHEQTCKLYSLLKNDINQSRTMIVGGYGSVLFAYKIDNITNGNEKESPLISLQILYTQ